MNTCDKTSIAHCMANVILLHITLQDADGDVEIVMKPKTADKDEPYQPNTREQETPPPPYPPTSPSQYAHKTQHEPRAQKHCRTHQPHSSLAEHLYIAPPTQAGMERRSVLGLSGRGRNNVCWIPSTGRSGGRVAE